MGDSLICVITWVKFSMYLYYICYATEGSSTLPHFRLSQAWKTWV